MGSTGHRTLSCKWQNATNNGEYFRTETFEGIRTFPTLYFKFLRSAEDEAELELNAEFERRGVKLTPGAGFYCEEPGWFRVTFAKPKETLDLGNQQLCEQVHCFPNQ